MRNVQQQFCSLFSSNTKSYLAFKKFRTKNCEKNPTSEDRKNKYIKERQNKMERREKENIYGDFHCFLVKEMKRLRKLQRQVSALI